ncbi:MAG TPA: RidA family protein [Propionibacteriaceae bacterium]|nr:RidA family protein [Propionibacteriaceae bacterium]
MTSEMERTAIVAPNAPGGRSYSQAVGVGDFVFVAGTAGKNMETGTFPAGIAAQMEQAIKNIGEVLAAADCRLDDVVKVTTYITPEAYAVDEEAVWPRRSTRAHSPQSRSLRDRHRGWLYLFRRP